MGIQPYLVDTYGIYNGTTTIGSDDGDIHANTPVIIGGLYGIYGGTQYSSMMAYLRVTAGYTKILLVL